MSAEDVISVFAIVVAVVALTLSIAAYIRNGR